MFVKPFLNNFCSVTGCIILLKEANASGITVAMTGCTWSVTMVSRWYMCMWMPGSKVSQQSITRPPSACLLPIMHHGVFSFPGRQYTGTQTEEHIRPGHLPPLLYGLVLALECPLVGDFSGGQGSVWAEIASINFSSNLWSSSSSKGLGPDGLAFSPHTHNLVLVKVAQIFTLSHFSCFKHLNLKSWLFTCYLKYLTLWQLPF